MTVNKLKNPQREKDHCSISFQFSSLSSLFISIYLRKTMVVTLFNPKLPFPILTIHSLNFQLTSKVNIGSYPSSETSLLYSSLSGSNWWDGVYRGGVRIGRCTEIKIPGTVVDCTKIKIIRG